MQLEHLDACLQQMGRSTFCRRVCADWCEHGRSCSALRCRFLERPSAVNSDWTADKPDCAGKSYR